jgi:predicted Holliday junction resolvase-like endonuclease
LSTKDDLIKQLQSDPNLYGECPECAGSFPLHKAVMFNVDGPIPPKVKELIAQREQELKDGIKELREERKKTKKRSEVSTKAINIGKILEKIAPAVRGFKYDPRDCRGIFEPIDYIVFNGLAKHNGNVDSLVFLDIKTGRSALNEHQKQIRDAVQNGKVSWDKYGK